MRGVIYARYSSDNQREESIEGQIRENTAYANKNGIDIVGTYIDRAYSAKTDNRPEFQRMIKDSAKKSFDVVIVWKLDRFSRNRYDSAKYKAMLRKNDVKVVSATESISEGAEGIIDYIKLILTFDDKPINIPTSDEIEYMVNSSDIQSSASPTKKQIVYGLLFLLLIRPRKRTSLIAAEPSLYTSYII